MIDIKVIRESPDKVRHACKVKNITCDVDRLLAVDARRRAIQQETDSLRSKSKELSGQVGLYKNPKSKWYQEALAKGRTDAELRAEGIGFKASRPGSAIRLSLSRMKRRKSPSNFRP